MPNESLRKVKREESRSATVTDDPKQSAIAAGLRYMSDDSPGISRKSRGSEFKFYDSEGRVIKKTEELQRIRSLSIPPAWKNVWICARANGHLQATGIDARGRKQYKYHPDWREVRDAAKYERVMSFARTLPKKLPVSPLQRQLPRTIPLL